MKIGIIGCSHSSGLSEGGLLKKSGGFNAWKGWPRELAKAYPQHDVHLFASPGGGQNNMESALRTCLIENFDTVLLQFTTQRQLYPTQIDRFSKKIDGSLDTWFTNQRKNNFILQQQKMRSLSIKNYVIERKCVMVGNHFDARNRIKELKDLSVNAYELPQVLLDIFIDNEYFNEMAETFYNCNKLYKKLFKHFYSMLWVPTLSYGPSSSDQSVVEIKDKVPLFMSEFLTGKNLSDKVDWPQTVYTWLGEHWAQTLNMSLPDAKRIVFHEYKKYKGHLGEDAQRDVLFEYILENNELKEALG
tara:strand:+ start:2220 stop:3125 length:906 start_codon:yes stop_codon:yes gene_type:complete